MTQKIYLNGALVPKEDAKISVYDHGLLYGDGVFEGIRVYGGKVFLLPEHIKRLYESALAIRLAIPMSQTKMAEAVESTVAANALKDGYIRLVVTRGAGTLGLDIRRTSDPQVIIIVDTITHVSGGHLSERDGPRHGQHDSQSSARAFRPHQVAQLPQQHSGKDGGDRRRV